MAFQVNEYTLRNNSAIFILSSFLTGALGLESCLKEYRLYIHIDKGRNSTLKGLGYRFAGEKYYSSDEIIVIIGDVCSRMGPLNESTCFILDD